MKIIILHGPNLNLIGSMSVVNNSRITLDKINTSIKRHVRNFDVKIKIEQTHKTFQAINFIQRNRNWADAILIAPSSWARYEYSVLDAIRVSNIKSIQILFSKGYGDVDEAESIFSKLCVATLTGKPDSVYLDGIDLLLK